MKNHFTILITSYNVESWAEKNISSALKQNYHNYDILLIDDASTDKTFKIVERCCEETSSYCSNIKTIKNSFNKGKMENVYSAMDVIKDGSIIIILDGDDWLAHENVLSVLNNVYDENVWMTSGSYVENISKRIVNPKIDDDYWEGVMRHKTWETSHLSTFRKELFLKIKCKHLMKKTGEFFSTTSDQAMMWPILEMSGKKHFRVINEVLYVYNRSNPLSDDRAFRRDQLETERVIRNMKPYEPLETL